MRHWLFFLSCWLIQESLKEARRQEKSCIYCAWKFVEIGLPNNPCIYEDFFRRMKNQEDAYFCEVMKRAYKQGIVWAHSSLQWDEELEIFLFGERGASVFKEWLNIPYVRKLALTQLDGTAQTIMLRNPERVWDSLGHALASLKLSDHLQVLLEAIPECSTLRVSEVLSI